MAGRALNIPTEAEEQNAFVQWCRINYIIVHHSPNEGAGGTSGAIRGAKMKKLGTSKGFWDLIVFIPIRGITGRVDCYEQVMIEMKRRKGGVVSEEQKTWGKIYELAGIPCKICRGADEAIAFVNKYLKKDNFDVY